jgi:lysophospholipase
MPVSACSLSLALLPRSGSAMKLVAIPDNPGPDDAVTGKVRTPDGVELRFARWDCPLNGKGTVCVFTGRGEFIEK